MAITGVGGFFGGRNRLRKPAGVDVIFTTDESGSMAPFVDFVNASSTIVSLENALIREKVGVLVPNRYNKSSMQTLYESSAGRTWELGSDIVANPPSWQNWAATGFRWGASQEDVTGAAYRIANTVYPYGFDTTNNPATNGSVFDNSNSARRFRKNASQIMIAASDEQNAAVQYFPEDVYARITDVETFIRYIGVSRIEIRYTGSLPDEYVATTATFGIVFSSPTVWKLVLRPLITSSLPRNVPIFLDANSNQISFYANSNLLIQDTSASGPALILPNLNDPGQRVNTPKLARGTIGAVYDILQFLEPNGPAVFGDSLGQTLGRYLYGLE